MSAMVWLLGSGAPLETEVGKKRDRNARLRSQGSRIRRPAGVRHRSRQRSRRLQASAQARPWASRTRSEEHTSELQSLMRISYAVFCLKKKTKNHDQQSRLSVISNTISI